ncbi:MAG: hypothetical protein AAF985_05030 [Bacteroidota bacterium]
MKSIQSIRQLSQVLLPQTTQKAIKGGASDTIKLPSEISAANGNG